MSIESDIREVDMRLSNIERAVDKLTDTMKDVVDVIREFITKIEVLNDFQRGFK